jgi:signal transduction histidine kinase
MNHYELGALLTVIWTWGMAAFILVREWKRPVTRWYGICVLSIGAWAFGYYRMISANTAESSLFWAKALHLPSSFIPTLFLHFTQVLINKQEKHQLIVRRISYYFSFFFALVSFHPIFVDSVQSFPGFKFYLIWGEYYFLYFLFFAASSTYVFSFLIYYFLTETIKKNNLGFILIAYSICYAGGLPVFFPHFGISVPTFSLYLIPLGHAIVFYAIIQHKLLNIKIFLRRIGLLVTIYALLILTAFPILGEFFKLLTKNESLSAATFTSTIIFLSLLFSLGPFVYSILSHRLRFFQEETMAGLTHELKSPLAAIESALDMINQQSASLSHKGNNKDYLEMIERNSGRLRQFVDDLLQTFQNRGEAVPLNLKEENVVNLCQEILDRLKPQAEAKQIELVFNSSLAQPLMKCDQLKMVQIISNLLSNAIKFTSKGFISLNLQLENQFLKITVKDSGVGISKDELPYVFDRFFQGEEGRKKKGSGLGLSIAKGWVEAHGGKIWAESDGAGKGATFKIELPIT